MAPRSAPDLTGKVIIVTGANAGLGYETAVALGAMGATVVMTARNPDRGAAAHEAALARSPGADLVLGELDLASFASIRSFAAWFLDRFDRLDVLVNNAGLILDGRQETTDGFEMTFGVNHLGHFLLTDLLRDRLVASAPSRVVVLTSLAHRLAVGGLHRDDLQSTRRYRGFPTYCRSKLANAQFVTELARQLDGTGVTVNGVHPGSVNSHFGGDGDTGVMGWFIARFGRIVLRSPRAAARTQVLLASSDEARIAGVTGGYFSHGRRWRASRQARNAEAARWLWAESERLVAEVP
ncbi:MAG: SDR family NAD(P)-dependent oxidoreductase [Acidimicrobiales bacterium]|nr:SDR family NAD(P)-dependent oxidoreductase [Acidimicrobiales bacterium]